MDWVSPFIIYRITPDAKLEEVYHASDIKSAKYWLAFIAKPGDVLCKTPIHPKHSKQGKSPEYWSHKEQHGSSTSSEAGWKKLAQERNFNLVFPEEQTRNPNIATTTTQS